MAKRTGRGAPAKSVAAAIAALEASAAPAPPEAATESIRLQFVLAEGLASRLIAWWGQGYGGWSHVDAVLPDGSLLGARSDRVGGQPPGVRIRPPGYEPVRRRAIVRLAMTVGQARAWEAFLKSQVGKSYDTQAIWDFILGSNKNAPGRWICSALQTAALRQIGRLHPLPIPDSQVTPDALFLLVTAGLDGAIEPSEIVYP